MTDIEHMARRTRVAPGKAEAYARTHASLPQAVIESLWMAGIVSWRIWADGDNLFHFIESKPGTWEALRAVNEAGPIDPGWDALIASLLSLNEGDNVELSPVWGMNPDMQWAGNRTQGRARGTPR